MKIQKKVGKRRGPLPGPKYALSNLDFRKNESVHDFLSGEGSHVVIRLVVLPKLMFLCCPSVPNYVSSYTFMLLLIRPWQEVAGYRCVGCVNG